MTKRLAIILVAALSGVPATGIVCDLLLCAEHDAAPVQGCHEHAEPSAGDVVSSSARGCTHLSDSAPFVASNLRPMPAAAAPAHAAAPPVQLVTDGTAPAPAARGAPRPAPSTLLALRI